MSEIKALTLEELEKLDGQKVFTVPLIINKPSFSTYYVGLGFFKVNILEQKLENKDGDCWDIRELNCLPYGFLAFPRQVTWDEALKAWKELKKNGMVKYEPD